MSEKTKTAGEVYEQNIGSVVYVSTQSGRGSGVVVGDNEVVTNCHVIDDGSPIMVTKPNADFTDSQQVPAKVAAASRLDMCLLKTDGLTAQAVDFGESTSMRIGDPVYAIGNPSGVYGVLSSGIVSQVHPSVQKSGEGAGCMLQTTAALAGGSSGGGLFDHQGRLVGITHQSGTGESAHMALPVDLATYLRQRVSVEARLHGELTAALNAPLPGNLRGLADKIVGCLDHPALVARALRDIGFHEAQHGKAEHGDLGHAEARVKSICALRDQVPPEHRDLIMVDAIHVLATMGDIKAAQKLAENLNDKTCRTRAFAHIVRELARKSVDEARRLCDKHLPPETMMLDDADPETMSEIASTRAAMEDSELALRIADKMIRSSRDLVLSAETLARIAYYLQKQNVIIGARAIFGFAMDLAHNPKLSGSIFDRLMSLAIVAYHAANCGTRSEAVKALKMMGDFEDKHGSGDEDYSLRVQRMGLVAEACALCGNWEEAIEHMRRIPILGGEIVPALVITAIKMSQVPR